MDKSIILVDLEGTLSDCRHRLCHLEEKSYDVWNELLYSDPPVESMCRFVESLQKHFVVYIATAKPEQYREDVINWLSSNTSIKPSEIMMRQSGDMRSSVELKQTWVESIAKNAKIALAVDDRLEICKMYTAMGIMSVKAMYEHSDSTPAKSRKVDEILTDGAKFFGERAKEYGTAYLRHGPIMSAFFPDGIQMNEAKDFYQWHIFELMVIKMNRLASAMMRGETHPDSLHDIMIYAAMATEGIENE